MGDRSLINIQELCRMDKEQFLKKIQLISLINPNFIFRSQEDISKFLLGFIYDQDASYFEDFKQVLRICI